MAKKARSKPKSRGSKAAAKATRKLAPAVKSKPKTKPKPKARQPKPAKKAVKPIVAAVASVVPRPAAGGPATVGLRVADDPYLQTGSYTFSPSDWQISESICDPLTGFASGDAKLVITAKYQRDPDEQP